MASTRCVRLSITARPALVITAFATNTRTGQLPDLELRHRRRGRAEDRIRVAKDTGLSNLPLHGFAQNQIWCAVVTLATELTAWMQMLAFPRHQARRWEPKRLRLRLFTIPAVLARTGRRVMLHLTASAAWALLAVDAIQRLHAPRRPRLTRTPTDPTSRTTQDRGTPTTETTLGRTVTPTQHNQQSTDVNSAGTMINNRRAQDPG